MINAKIEIPIEAIRDFCRKWKVAELSLFGSVLREDFGPESDVDVLVAFEPSANWSYFELFDMQDALEEMIGRQVDLVPKGGLKNPFRRAEILGTRKVLYAA